MSTTPPPLLALNIFSHCGGIAEGLQGLTCVGYTTLIESLKEGIEKKINEGVLSRGKIYKYSHNIKSNVEKTDLLFGLIHHPEWQKKELRWGKGVTDNISPGMVHRRSLHEVMIVQKCCQAKKILLFFPYNPFSHELDTMSVFHGLDVWMRCFEFSLIGEFTPTRHLYILEITCEPATSMEINFTTPLPLKVEIPTTETPLSPDNFTKHAMIWDISPSVVYEAVNQLKDIKELQKNILTIISSSIPPSKNTIDYISPNQNLFSQIPLRNSLGWGG